MKVFIWSLVFFVLLIVLVQGLTRQYVDPSHSKPRSRVFKTAPEASNQTTPEVAKDTAAFAKTDSIRLSETSAVNKIAAIENELFSADSAQDATQKLSEIIDRGTRAEVAAVLLRFDRLPEFAKTMIIKSQASLCRFQNSSEQPSFDWLKAKLSLQAQDSIAIQPWSDICKG